ncbi:PPPDE putative peptidase domain-containing protein [Stachybotrys elegans]|uniref:PPPDE putative peptidase domain-containing protein n=1 Tax=Stachybotrys elegans TaxID=80388 RepID=A0A8K0SJT4_9HYPO|nr:PPPDE putative peptidase domain-containing protein [Stachybotrys elegans]
MPPRAGSGQRVSKHRSTLSLQKTEISIHVYDLLPPGRLSSTLWTVGASLLHSGVVINGKEYAYGGHQERGVTGVYWTKPKTVPPGGTFRCEILHGFTLATDEEIEATLRSASEAFLGTSYNILTKNCNHFTAYLCQKLTGTPSPGWLNRAASIGVALPCMVPREWVEPPDFETAEGELLDEDATDEHSRMLGPSPPHRLGESSNSDGSDDGYGQSSSRRQQVIRDTDGRRLPAAETAPRR